jgi:predicted subunit of tRNA(5-methylaminomethyl-2-thiouridylate) methyltransferase
MPYKRITMASTKKLTTEEVIQRFKERRQDKGEFYNYSQVQYVNYFTKVKIICPLHGEFYQLPSEHSKDCTGCKECEKIKLQNTWDEKRKVPGFRHTTHLSTEDLIEKFKQKREDKGEFYDYSQVEYLGRKIPIKIICPIHGEFYQKPFNHVSGSGCKECSKIKRKNTPCQKKLPTTEKIIERIKRKREDKGEFYDYSQVEFVDYNTDIKIICPLHGEFYQNPLSHINGYTKCQECLIINRKKKKRKKQEPKITTDIIIQRFKERREDKGEFYDYSQVQYVNNSTKVKIICPLHGAFYQLPTDHTRGYSGCKECANIKRQTTCLETYGCETPLQNEQVKEKIKQTNLKLYGVENPSQCPEIHQRKVETCLKNYGCEYGPQSPIVKQKIIETNMERYGVSCAMEIPEIAQKSVGTRIKNNSFHINNHSIEARDFIRTYINEKGYSIDQCAFSDKENQLFEWGYYIKDRWVLYDLVVFEPGFRGNKDHIIEILEYNGPFHYTEQDVIERGEQKATPWKKSKLTIKESYQIDKLKEEFAKTLTDNFTVIWPERYHPNE